MVLMKQTTILVCFKLNFQLNFPQTKTRFDFTRAVCCNKPKLWFVFYYKHMKQSTQRLVKTNHDVCRKQQISKFVSTGKDFTNQY